MRMILFGLFCNFRPGHARPGRIHAVAYIHDKSTGESAAVASHVASN